MYFAYIGPYSQSYGFSSSHVWMWELDNKKGRVTKNRCLWTCDAGVLLRVHWTSRRSNQLILKEINPEYPLEGLMLKLKLQCFGHLMRSADSLGKTLMLGKIEGGRRRGQQRMRWMNGIQFNGHEFVQTLGDSEGQGSLVCCSPWSHKELNTAEWQSNNIETTAMDDESKVLFNMSKSH